MPPRSPTPAPPSGSNMESMIVDVAIAIIVFLLLMGLFASFLGYFGTSYVGLVQGFYSLNWKLWYIITAIFVVIIDIALLVFGAAIIKKFNALKAEVPPREIETRMMSPEQEFQKNWEEIHGLMASGNASDWNMAILRADAQLEAVLTSLGYEGDTIADRLKIVDPTKLKSMDRVWSAHRLRNTIAHDPLQQYTREMMTHALASYQLAFKDLGFLQEVGPE